MVFEKIFCENIWKKYSELWQTSKIELFEEIVSSQKPLTIFAKKYSSQMFLSVLNMPLTGIF